MQKYLPCSSKMFIHKPPISNSLVNCLSTFCLIAILRRNKKYSRLMCQLTFLVIKFVAQIQSSTGVRSDYQEHDMSNCLSVYVVLQFKTSKLEVNRSNITMTFVVRKQVQISSMRPYCKRYFVAHCSSRCSYQSSAIKQTVFLRTE